MLNWIREKFGKAMIGGIISFIAFVFVFYGVFSPKSTRGLHEGAVAGTVNGDAISIPEFNRELNQRVEFYKQLAGGKITDEQLKSFQIREAVFQSLVNRRLQIQEAKRQGLLISDEEVKEKIQEIPAFKKDGKKDGKFDFQTYKTVLESNNYTPGGFEKLVREDSSLQKWQGYFQDRVHVSNEEIKKEYILNHDKRKIKYVLLTPENARKNIHISNDEIEKFLKDPTKLNLAKIQYNEGKETKFKDQKFEDAQKLIAKEILAGEKVEQIQKINQDLADKALAILDAKASSDSKLNQLLKPVEAKVQTTPFLTRRESYVPGVGDVRELLADAFSEKSPIDSAQGGKPKKYNLGGRILVGMVVEAERPDLGQMDAQKPKLSAELVAKKSQALYQDWLAQLSSKAKIEENQAVVGSAVE